MLRNEDSGLSSTVRDISTLKRIVLTGTPLQNNLKEYHCMVDFVRPGLLGELNTFKRDFVNPILHGQCIDAHPEEVKLMKKRSHILHSLLKCCVDRADFKVSCAVRCCSNSWQLTVDCRSLLRSSARSTNSLSQSDFQNSNLICIRSTYRTCFLWKVRKQEGCHQKSVSSKPTIGCDYFFDAPLN